MKQISLARRMARLLATSCFIAACAGTTAFPQTTTGAVGTGPAIGLSPAATPRATTGTAAPGGAIPYSTMTSKANSLAGTSEFATTQVPGAVTPIPTETTPGATPAPLGTNICAPAIGAGAGCAPGTGTRVNGIVTPPETAYPLSPGTSTPQ